MDEEFNLPVTYRGQQQNFKTRLVKFRYMHKLEVEVEDGRIFIEKDNEGNYRAILANIESENKIDKGLIKAIVESLQEILK